MILLDEIDVKEKDRRESLPPYSPRRGSVPVAADSQLSLTSTLRVQAYHQPRSATFPSHSVQPSTSSYTLGSSYSESTQTLVPHSPIPPALAPSPSTSQLSIPTAPTTPMFTLASLPLHRLGPPPHLRAANNVYVQRGAAAITSAFAIDPKLAVPDCLLPDDPDVLLVDGKRNAKGKGKRTNLCLVTRSGDVCVDVWVREGCATGGKRRARGKNKSVSQDGGEDEHYRSRSVKIDEDSDYWSNGWTSPPPELSWPQKTKSPADIDIRSEGGSITLRIHAQSHQRLRIHLSSKYGNISVGIPRTFVGSVYANSPARSESADSPARTTFASSSSTYLPANGSASGWNAEKSPGSAAGTSIDGHLAFTPRQPVQFSEAMEGVVTAVYEQRKNARGSYFVGTSPTEVFSEHMGTRYFDELHIESRTGAIGVFFNDEPPQQKQNGLITKLLHKAW
ncbi:hypothetical protein M0805_006203 [Coniferiporia weirii]|nr:hypothetical protein M0805_006203 [Coniferiporia weirii]